METKGRTDTRAQIPEQLAPPPTTGDPVEIAMEAERHDVAADSPARTVLIRQVGLIQSQTRLADVQIASERAGLLLKAAGGVAAAAAAGLLAILVWNASQASGLVIEAFSVPPALAEQGLTGEVVAAEVQDRIAAMQAQTRSSRAEESFETNWGGNITVEIPQTGVSVGELQSWLRDWLGRQTRVGGSVTRTSEGLRVTARLAGRPADVAIGSEADLDDTIARAAEALFARTQPYRYGIWLAQNGRMGEARTFFEGQIAVTEGDEMAWAFIGRAFTEPLPQIRTDYFERALALNPNFALARSNLGAVYAVAGRAEAALAAKQAAVRAVRRRDSGGVNPGSAAVMGAQDEFDIALVMGDGEAALRFADQIRELPDFYGSRFSAPGLRAAALTILHDAAGARKALQLMGPDDAAILQATASTNAQMPYLTLAIQEERWTDAALLMDRVRGLPIEFQGVDPWSTPLGVATAARVMAGVGRLDDAEALIATTELNCYGCVLVRAWIAEGRGDKTSADHWFTEAMRIGPSLAEAPLAYGRALLARGDAAGALVQFREANSRAPRWADPLKFWGDALIAQGDKRGAAKQYQEAAERAPLWTALQEARAGARRAAA